MSLAASLVADGHRVALVDCDLHQPNVHRMFEGPRGPGLTDYFIGDAALSEIVHTDRGSGVDYVRAGAAQSQEACHITFDRLRAVVERLIKEYTFVILDSAPVLAVSERPCSHRSRSGRFLLSGGGGPRDRLLAMRSYRFWSPVVRKPGASFDGGCNACSEVQ